MTSSACAKASARCCPRSSHPGSCGWPPTHSTPRSATTSGIGAWPAMLASGTPCSNGCTRAADVTIKWVQQDPLVMNGEPFCYGSRLTVRQLLELRSNGYDLTRILKDHPELRVLGIAAAYAYAAEHRDGYADFFQKDGSLTGPGYTEAEAARLTVEYRQPGIVIRSEAPAA